MAKFFALQWHQDGLGPYIVFEGQKEHGDGAILAAQLWLADRLAARQLANRAVVSRLAELRGSFDTVFVATDQHVPAAWQGLGPTLERYGKAFGLDMPAVVNLPCDKSRELTSTQRVAVAAYGSHCPGFAGDRPIVVQYRRLSLFELRVMADSLRVDFMVPSSLEGARVP
jgi:hypothetical protein